MPSARYRGPPTFSVIRRSSRVVDIEREADTVDIEPQGSLDIAHRYVITSTESSMTC
jgi:hypothetical protein